MMMQPVPSIKVKTSVIMFSMIEEEEEEEEVVVETTADSELSSSAADKYGIVEKRPVVTKLTDKQLEKEAAV